MIMNMNANLTLLLRKRNFSLFLVFCLFSAILSSPVLREKEASGQIEAQVSSVVDGDTVRVMLAGEKKSVSIRLYGIDAPEKDQAFGAESSAALASLLPKGCAVFLDVINQDRYGRKVAILTRQGHDESVNSWLISEGWAWVWPQYCKRSLCGDWKKRSRMAKAEKRGLWKDAHPVAPWDWRRSSKRF